MRKPLTHITRTKKLLSLRITALSILTNEGTTTLDLFSWTEAMDAHTVNPDGSPQVVLLSLNNQENPSEVLPPLHSCTRWRGIFSPSAETLVLFLQESNIDLYWLYAYDAALLISDQYRREAWKQYSGS